MKLALKQKRSPTPLTAKSLDALQQLRADLSAFLPGKDTVTDMVVCCLVGSGHLLLEDIPGVGKTTLIRALARRLGLDMSRIQGTSDLLPSDILGMEVFSKKTEKFVFHPGPIFAPIVLVDELNRTSPRTQSALLEAMAEGAVTINRQRYPLPQPFLLFATQNPGDQLGTYPLPESQLDRFAAKIRLWYPIDTQEREILTRGPMDPIENLKEGTAGRDHLPAWQAALTEVFLSDRVVNYMKRVLDKTRQDPSLRLGISTRGGVIWGRMARARALMNGRDFVTPDDLVALAVPCLSHRLVPQAASGDPALLLETLLKTVDPD